MNRGEKGRGAGSRLKVKFKRHRQWGTHKKKIYQAEVLKKKVGSEGTGDD